MEHAVTVSPPIPAGRKLCPTCHGRCMIGSSSDTNPEDVWSDDCPTCAVVDQHGRRTDAGSLGHVARR